VQARKPLERAWLGMHGFQPGVDQRGELGEVALGEVGQGPRQVRSERLDRVELMCMRRELVRGQPGRGRRSARPSRRQGRGARHAGLFSGALQDSQGPGKPEVGGAMGWAGIGLAASAD
jgi:hypothetical protein